MRKVSASVVMLVIILLGLTANAFATSPMPAEVKPGQAATLCTIHIAYVAEREGGALVEQTSTFAFEVSEAKKDVFEWVARHINNKFNERNVSQFKIECRFQQ